MFEQFDDCNSPKTILDYENLIVKDNTIDISESTWTEMKNSFSKEKIIQFISDLVPKRSINLPLRQIYPQEALNDFLELYQTDCIPLIKSDKFFSRYEYKYASSDYYIEQSKIGNRSSDFFHQENRWKCDSINAPSPYRTWHNEKFRKTLLNAIWTLKYDKIDMGALRSAIGLRKYIASQFRPSAAKAIYQYFNAENILDFSSGWGDRLSGFFATKNAKSYLGIDPNTNLKIGYEKQIEEYSKLVSEKKEANIIYSPAEEVELKQEFDLIFTSPPYFIVERYTQDKNQSWKKYKKINDWLNNFLFPVLNKSWNALKPNGHMIINISDVYCNHTINNICDPMNDYISQLSNSQYVGCWGLKMSKRPLSKASGIGIFAEPIWIWKKSIV